MGTVTLKIPAEHVNAFRLAAVDELQTDADGVADSAKEASTWISDHPTERPDKDQLADVRLSARFLSGVVDVTEQLFGAERPDAIEVRGDVSNLAHMAETMARKIVEPQIKDEAAMGPFDTEAAEKIGALTSAMGWATGEAARLHAISHAEIKAARAVDPRAVAD
jgi:hypothetical protein